VVVRGKEDEVVEVEGDEGFVVEGGGLVEEGELVEVGDSGDELMLSVSNVMPQHEQALLYREIPEQGLA
jgi:hypothetical protein